MRWTPGRRRGASAWALAGLLATLVVGVPRASAATAPVELTVDGLTVRAVASPWSVEIVDAAGRLVLAQHPGTGPTAAGTLGFQTTAGGSRRHRVGPVLPDKAPFGEVDTPSAGWFHATEAESLEVTGGALTATLATSDPLGRTIELRITGAGDGSVRLVAEVDGPTADVEAVGMGFRARDGERFLGFGQRYDAVAREGVVEHYVGEGPYQREEYPFLQPAIIPAWGARQRADATYFPMPWLLSTAGYGVLLDNDEVSNHRLRADDESAWSVEALATSIDLTVHSGPSPADALRRLVDDVGRQPEPRPAFYGPWVQPPTSFAATLGEQLAVLRGLRQAGAPMSALEVTHRYLPCGQYRGQRESIQTAVRAYRELGVESYGYNNPLLCRSYTESYDKAVATGGYQRRPDGEPYLFNSYVGAATPPVELMGHLDLGQPAGDAVFHDNLALAVEDGHDGWMEDFGEYTPFDAVSADGTTGDRLHNRFPRDYHCSAQRFADDRGLRPTRFVRSGWTGSAACSPLVWSGDPTVGWGFDGLASQVTAGLTAGLSGVSMWGSDIGGFFALGLNQLSEELLIRWVQLGAVSPSMRTRTDGVAVPPKPRPQVWDPAVLPQWRRWSSLHLQLLPYLEAATAEYETRGVPIMRHHVLTHPDDAAAVDRGDQYLFGPDLLAAPVVTQGATSREVYLPAGQWIELERAWAFDRDGEGGHDLAARPSVLDGRQGVTVDAPLEELPLFARRGALLPLLPRDVETAATYGEGDVVRALDAEDRRELLAFPAGESTASFGPSGEALRSEEGEGSWSLSFDQARTREWRLQAALGTLHRPFVPCAVRLDGRPVPGWTYDEATTVLAAQVTTASGRLDVTGCPPAGSPAAAPEARGRAVLADTGLPAAALLGVLLLLAGAALARRRVRRG